MKYKELITTNRLIILLCVLGLALSAYLWAVQVQSPNNVIVPCFTGGGCESVLNSKYGEMFGVPMSVFGFFFYAFLIFTALLREKIKDKLLTWILQAEVFWGVLFSLYLRYLEFVVIRHVCSWCWMSVIIIILLAAALAYEQRSPKI
ncbi:MAG: vitamin K epoxide reductase family protein [bacterium]